MAAKSSEKIKDGRRGYDDPVYCKSSMQSLLGIGFVWSNG